MTIVITALISVLAGFAVGCLVGVRRADPPTAVQEAAPTPAPELSWPHHAPVLDQLPIGIVIVAPDRSTVYRNPWATTFAGTHAGVLLNATMEPLLEQALVGEHSRQVLELYGPPRRSIAVASSPLPGGGALASIQDESERRRIDAVRTDFVANISHELKTPVGALAVLAETLVGETDPEVIDRVAERMVSDAHRAAHTIDDLLELAGIEMGEALVRERVDVAGVIAESISRSRQIGEQRNIHVEVLDAPKGAAVVGDRRQLVSALGNLVENAVKYSEPGGEVQIRVRTDNDFVEMMVADRGIGIPVRDHDRIFERFYRVDRARSRDTGGTGLGLSIVRHVADNHGGEVLVSSQEGEGSTFVLRIPTSSRIDELRPQGVRG
ncbi:MAG: ATP-binding protein [Actinomycetota bacterium]|nr:ATP-binding protein [Actinomycetota bacterium]